MKTTACIFILLIDLLALAIPAYAQAPTPTPTATLRPIQPTQTSVYLYLRPTPTPLNIVLQDYGFSTGSGQSAQIADNAINIYRSLNTNHIMDYAMFGVLLVVNIGYLVTFIGRTTRNKG